MFICQNSGYMLICRNAEGYMVRKRLGTPVLKPIENVELFIVILPTFTSESLQ